MNVLPLPAPTGGPAAASDTTLGDGAPDAAAGFVAALAEALAMVSSEVPTERAEELVAVEDDPDAVEQAPGDHRSATAVAVLGAIAEWRAAGRPDQLGESVHATVTAMAGRPAPAAPVDAVPITVSPVVPVDVEPGGLAPTGADASVPAATLAPPAPPTSAALEIQADASGTVPVGPTTADDVTAAAPTEEAAPAPSGSSPAAVEVTVSEALPEGPSTPLTDAPEPTPDAAVTIETPVAAAPRSDRAERPLPSAAAERVLRAIEVLQHAPPPRRLSFDVDGVRITVALQTDGVAVDLRGPGGPVPTTWRSDLGATLAAHGFDLASGNPDRQPTPHRGDAPPAPRPATPRPTPTRDDHGLRL